MGVARKRGVGRRAGLAAAEYAKGLGSAPKVDEARAQEAIKTCLAPMERDSGPNPYDVHHELQESMGQNVGIFRTEADMQKGLDNIQALKEKVRTIKVTGSRVYNPGWHLAMDLNNMLVVSEAITRGALLRKESRGAHSRLDYEGKRDDFSGHNHTMSKSGDDMKIEATPLPEMPAELKDLFEQAKVKA